MLLAAGSLGLAANPASASQAATAGCTQTVQLKVAFQDSGCWNDFNVSWSNISPSTATCMYYWGEYWNGSAWISSTVGQVYMCDGNQSPWKVLATSILTGTWLRGRGYHAAYIRTET